MKQITHHLAITAFIVSLCWTLTCLTPPRANADFQKTKIAVLDFVLHGDKLETEGMGAILSEWFITSIVKSGRFDVVERAMLQKIISEQKLATTGLIDENSATELGKILGVRVIITGSVLKLQSTVEINARVISVESGSIIAAENIRGHSSSDLQTLVAELTHRIMLNFPLNGYIVKKSPKSVIIDLGFTAGLNAGTEFIVYKEGAVIKHPKTGEVLDVEQIHTGRIRIKKVRRNVAEGDILSEKGDGIAYGQLVQSTKKPDSVQPAPARKSPTRKPQKKEVAKTQTAAPDKVILKREKKKVQPPPPQQTYVQKQKATPPPPPPPPPRPSVLNAAIFPWVLEDEGSSFLSYLKDGIKYRVEDSSTLKLKKSYYKMKMIPKLNASGSSMFYYKSKPNLAQVKRIATAQDIHIAILGTMRIHCRWSDNCRVNYMDIMLIDVSTGNITFQSGSARDMEARDLIDQTISKVFKKYNKNH